MKDAEKEGKTQRKKRPDGWSEPWEGSGKLTIEEKGKKRGGGLWGWRGQNKHSVRQDVL